MLFHVPACATCITEQSNKPRAVLEFSRVYACMYFYLSLSLSLSRSVPRRKQFNWPFDHRLPVALHLTLSHKSKNWALNPGWKCGGIFNRIESNGIFVKMMEHCKLLAMSSCSLLWLIDSELQRSERINSMSQDDWLWANGKNRNKSNSHSPTVRCESSTYKFKSIL